MTVNSPEYVTRSNPQGTDLLRLGAFLEYSAQAKSDVIEIAVGISFISVQQAKLNRLAQARKNGKLSVFDQVLAQTQKNWRDALDTVQVQAGPGQEADLVKFYSSLYQSYAVPMTFSETGRVYLGFDHQVHTLPDEQSAYYTEISIWDVHRTQMPFLGIMKPTVLGDIVRSLVQMYEQGGDLPKWPLADGYTCGMIGQHADLIIADAYFKGIPSLPMQRAYEGMKQGATQNQAHCGRDGLTDWMKLGYVTYEDSSHGSCLTQAYSYDDWAVGNVALALNYTQDAQIFLARSQNWKNVFHPKEKFFCPRSKNGQWECPPTWLDVFDSRYVEGDAWHYRFLVPHDTPGLVKAFGSNESFVDALYEFMFMSELDPLTVMPNPYYWAGNEEDLLSPWLFNYAGRADYTQRFTRYQTQVRYTTEPSGIPGNCDYAAMSAWYLFGALGFYPITGDPQQVHILGSPLFPQVTLFRENGLTLTIIAHDASEDNMYVQKATINGQPIDMKGNAFIHFSDFATRNATLEFWMTATAPSFYSQQ